MTRPIFTLLLAALLLQPPPAHAQGGKAAKAIITVLTGAAAAEAISQTVGAKLDYDEAQDALQRQGVNTTDVAVYSLYFTLNGDVSSMMWADIFNKPDIFAIVSIEGQGDFLIPQIYEEYSGQPILLNVVAKHAKPGQRIVVNIYDDDSWSNRVWNTIMQTRVSCSLGVNLQALIGFPVDAQVKGKFRLLDRDVTIDAPDYIATAEFKVPRFSWGHEFVASGPIVDSSHRTLGELRFARIWSPQNSPKEAARDAAQRFAFWGVLSIVLLGVCAWFMRSLWARPKEPNQEASAPPPSDYRHIDPSPPPDSIEVTPDELEWR